MRLRQIFEAPATAVMAFGRMNPPTIGHAKLVDAIKSQSGDPFIFLSQSQKPKTDPLSFQDKLRYAKFFFPNVTIGNPEVKTIIQALQKVESLGYQQLIYVAGSDRVQAFEELLNKYNGKDFTFKSIKVVSAGERDPDADGAEGMSASKMRQAAADNDIESFKQGVPQQEVADEMFAAVRKGMGVQDTVPAESLEEKANPAVAQKIKPLKMPTPPRAPDATIPRTRDGYTTDNGITYKQDKFNEKIMHVSTGGGDYTFDGSRLIKWTTPNIQGYRQIHNFMNKTIKVDANTTVKTKDGEVLISTNAVYDLQGNLKNAGELGVSNAGLGISVGDEMKMDYTISDNLSMHIQSTPKSKPSDKQIQAFKTMQQKASSSNQQLIDIASMARKIGASVTFKSPANAGAIPFNQGIKMLKQVVG